MTHNGRTPARLRADRGTHGQRQPRMTPRRQTTRHAAVSAAIREGQS